MYKLLGRKIAVIALIAGSTIAAFATLGDGNKKTGPGTSTKGKSILSNKTRVSNNFSLRSGYEFRGNQVINTRNQKFVNLHTTLTYRKGGINYILPIQKKVFLDKIVFNDDLLRSRRSY